MKSVVPEADNGRQLVIEEVAVAPGSVFLSFFLTPHDSETRPVVPTACYEFEKAALVNALRNAFGLVDPLGELLNE